jgi:hypothetical protein
MLPLLQALTIMPCVTTNLAAVFAELLLLLLEVLLFQVLVVVVVVAVELLLFEVLVVVLTELLLLLEELLFEVLVVVVVAVTAPSLMNHRTSSACLLAKAITRGVRPWCAAMPMPAPNSLMRHWTTARDPF